MARALVGSVALPFAAQAQAQEGLWLVRVRAVDLKSANKDSTGLGLTINDNRIPEVDISYFFTPNFATELVLTYPQKQSVHSNGTEIGSFKHLPPTLTVPYHFTGLQGFRPYVGAGLNLTHISSVDLLGGGATLKRNSFGLAAQVGVDVPLANGWWLNADVKKVRIKTDVPVGASEANAGTFKVDPWLIGVGVGMRF
jgi:outer membrane protein